VVVVVVCVIRRQPKPKASKDNMESSQSAIGSAAGDGAQVSSERLSSRMMLAASQEYVSFAHSSLATEGSNRLDYRQLSSSVPAVNQEYTSINISPQTLGYDRVV